MTEELNENVDSQNDDVEVETTEEETTTEDSKEELSDREKQFLARAKKAEGKLKEVKSSFEEPKQTETLKNNVEQSGLSRDEAIFFAKGGTEDDLVIAQKIAKIEDISILAAMEDPFYKSKVAERQEEAKIKSNLIGASTGGNGGGHKQKPLGKMTEEEHKAYFKARVNG